MNKAALFLAGLLAVSLVSCTKSESVSTPSEQVSAETAAKTIAEDETSAASTFSSDTNEMMEKAKENMKKSFDKVLSENAYQSNNTDEMDAEAKEVVNKFAKGVLGNDAEAMAEAMYPPKMLEGMKACGEYDSFKESVCDGDPIPLTSCTVKLCVKLKDDEKALAESYMNYYAKEYGLGENEYKVTDGYSFMADMESRHDNGVTSDAQGLIIVNIENEGWKIIPVSLKELTE